MGHSESKKEYIAPAVEMVTLKQAASLLQASNNGGAPDHLDVEVVYP